jgi:hypothetical protein
MAVAEPGFSAFILPIPGACQQFVDNISSHFLIFNQAPGQLIHCLSVFLKEFSGPAGGSAKNRHFRSPAAHHHRQPVCKIFPVVNIFFAFGKLLDDAVFININIF